MSLFQLAGNSTVSVAGTPTTIYTAPSNQAVAIKSFTAANNSSVNASYKAFIVSAQGLEQPQIPFKVVVWGENDLGIGIVNQVIPAGGTLKIECSAVNSIFFTVTGSVV